MAVVTPGQVRHCLTALAQLMYWFCAQGYSVHLAHINEPPLACLKNPAAHVSQVAMLGPDVALLLGQVEQMVFLDVVHSFPFARYSAGFWQTVQGGQLLRSELV